MNKVHINSKDVRKTKILYLEWSDAFSQPGWINSGNLDGPDVYKVCSVGYFIGENKTSYIITTSISVFGSTIDPLHIPKRWVIKKQFLK